VTVIGLPLAVREISQIDSNLSKAYKNICLICTDLKDFCPDRGTDECHFVTEISQIDSNLSKAYKNICLICIDLKDFCPDRGIRRVPLPTGALMSVTS